ERYGGRNLPCQHEQRKIPGDDLSAHAKGLTLGKFRFHELSPAGVVVEMAGNQRNIDVTRLTDRLSVVERLQHGKQPAVALDQPGQGIEIARALVPGEGGPTRLRPGRRLDSGIDILR